MAALLPHEALNELEMQVHGLVGRMGRQQIGYLLQKRAHPSRINLVHRMFKPRQTILTYTESCRLFSNAAGGAVALFLVGCLLPRKHLGDRLPQARRLSCVAVFPQGKCRETAH